jgi:hypothetical protein
MPLPGQTAAPPSEHGPLWPELEGAALLYDFCLMPYAPLAVPKPFGRATDAGADPRASVNVLLESFAAEGLYEAGVRLVERLLLTLGPQCTVWGVKRDHRPAAAGGADGDSWEFYFYRREHVPADLSIELVAPCFEPVGLDAALPEDIDWTFFSVEVLPEQLRGDPDAGPARVTVYREGENLAWKLEGGRMTLANHYTHYLAASEMPAFLARLQGAVHAPRHPLTVARLVPPPLHKAWRLWVASKQHSDTVYVQRVDVWQALMALQRFGAGGALEQRQPGARGWPQRWLDWFAFHGSSLAHVQFDIGYDFERVDLGSAAAGLRVADGEPPVYIRKSGIYASF